MVKKLIVILFFCNIAKAQFLSVPANTCTSTQAFFITNVGAGTLTGNATVSPPFFITSGSSYSYGSNQGGSLWVRYCPTGNNFDTNTITFTGGGGASTLVDGHSCIVGNLIFSSLSGISSGFSTAGGILTCSNGGFAYYMFFVTNAGSYMIRAIAMGTNGNANFALYGIDSQPIDVLQTWDGPVGNILTNQLISSRGTANFSTNRFVPVIYNLSTGIHQLILVGRGDNLQVSQIEIAQPILLAARIKP